MSTYCLFYLFINGCICKTGNRVNIINYWQSFTIRYRWGSVPSYKMYILISTDLLCQIKTKQEFSNAFIEHLCIHSFFPAHVRCYVYRKWHLKHGILGEVCSVTKTNKKLLVPSAFVLLVWWLLAPRLEAVHTHTKWKLLHHTGET